MNPLFLRVVVALTTFALSLGLTGFVRMFRSDDLSIAPVKTWSRSEQRLTLEYPISSMSVDELRLREIYRDYGPAQTRHDREFFERVETEDFILFVGDDHLSRNQDIQWMESLDDDIVFESRPESIKILGDWAMAHGSMEAHYSDGNVHSWGFIDVWVRRGGTWRIQSTTSVD
jgi:hypothetical protein